jgi:hypothetical protein
MLCVGCGGDDRVSANGTAGLSASVAGNGGSAGSTSDAGNSNSNNVGSSGMPGNLTGTGGSAGSVAGNGGSAGSVAGNGGSAGSVAGNGGSAGSVAGNGGSPGSTSDAGTDGGSPEPLLPEQAGCDANQRAVRHHASRQLLASPPEPAIGCLSDTGWDDVTPMIAVTRNGTVFVARSSGGVMRSKDGGATWTRIDVPAHVDGDSHTGGVHGFVHVDTSDDRVYYSTSLGAASCGASNGGTVVSWSDDLGETWDGSTVGCDTYDWGKLLTARAISTEASVVYFFGVGERVVGNERFVYRSRDRGETWERTRNIASATVEPGMGAAAPDGTIYFDQPESVFLGGPERKADKTYPWDPADECKLIIAVSEDEGDTWRHEPIPGSKACNGIYGQERVAVDADGNVYATWADDDDQQLYLSVSKDKGHTWSPRLNITSPSMNYVDHLTNVVAMEPGHIAVAYLGSLTSIQNGIFSVSSDRSGFIAESFDALEQNPTFDSVPLTAANDPMLVGDESRTEGQSYITFDQSGTPWAVFVEHSPAFGMPGSIVVGSVKHARE